MRTTRAASVLVECARHDLCSRWPISEEIVEIGLRGATRAALPLGFPCSILPCRWLRARRTVASASSRSWSLATPVRSLAHPVASVTGDIRDKRPSHEVRTLQRVKPRAATATRHLGFPWYLRLVGITSPDSATPSGFLSLLTSCSARSPSSLVSCWMHSWVFTFEGFPSPVAVSAVCYPAGCPSAGSSVFF